MADDDIFVTADRMLASMDFAALSAEREEKHRREMAGALGSFLPIVDSLEALEARCRELTEQGAQDVPLRSVSVLVKRAFQVLSGLGVEPMRARGGPVDLAMHEVVAVREDPTVEEDTVLEETLRGYLWKTSPLRQARVVVNRPASEDTEGGRR